MYPSSSRLGLSRGTRWEDVQYLLDIRGGISEAHLLLHLGTEKATPQPCMFNCGVV
jgi:hypothetical protein